MAARNNNGCFFPFVTAHPCFLMLSGSSSLGFGHSLTLHRSRLLSLLTVGVAADAAATALGTKKKVMTSCLQLDCKSQATLPLIEWNSFNTF